MQAMIGPRPTCHVAPSHLVNSLNLREASGLDRRADILEQPKACQRLVRSSRQRHWLGALLGSEKQLPSPAEPRQHSPSEQLAGALRE